MTLQCWESSALTPEHSCPNTCWLCKPSCGTKSVLATQCIEELILVKRKHSTKPLPLAPAFGFTFFLPLKNEVYITFDCLETKVNPPKTIHKHMKGKKVTGSSQPGFAKGKSCLTNQPDSFL